MHSKKSAISLSWFDEPKNRHSVRLIPLGPLALAILQAKRAKATV
jgi:hypothetical protein